MDNKKIIKFIKEIFPNEESLNTLDKFFSDSSSKLTKFSKRFHKIKERYNKSKKDVDSDEMFNIPILFMEELNTIKSNLEDASIKIGKFSSNIQILTNSEDKKSINMIKKLHILDDYTKKLREEIKKLNNIKGEEGLEKQFVEVKKFLTVSEEYLSFFESFKNLDTLKRIKENLFECKKQIYYSIERNFNFILNVKNKKFGKKLIEIINILTNEKRLTKVKLEIVKHYSEKKIKRYKSKFKDKSFILQERFKWILNYIRKHEVVFSYFPKTWYFQQELIMDFYLCTKPTLENYLDGFGNNEPQVFITMLLDTYEFEYTVQRKYGTFTKDQIENELEEINFKLEDINDKKISSKFGPDEKYKEVKELQDKVKELKSFKNIKHERNYILNSVLQKCFEPYMYIYTNYNSILLVKKINDIMSQENWHPNSSIHSGHNLFMLLESNLKDISRVSRGKTMFNIYKKNWNNIISIFLDTINQNIPIVKNGFLSKNNNMEEKKKYKLIQIIKVLDYAQNEFDKLEKLLIRVIIENYKKNISFKNLMKKCYDNKKKAILIFVNNTLKIVDSEMEKLKSTTWGTFKIMSIKMPNYIKLIRNLFVGECDLLFQYIPFDSSKLFLSILLKEFCKKYLYYLLRIKNTPITQFGIRQLKEETRYYKEDVFKKLLEKHKKFDKDHIKILDKEIKTSWKKIDAVFEILSISENEKTKTFVIYKEFFDVKNSEIFEKILNLKGWGYGASNGVNPFKTLKDFIKKKKSK